MHAPVGGHSEKPQLFLELIEGYFPTLPKIEFNRRGLARPGWDAWGNEATQFNAEIAAAHAAACDRCDGEALSERGDNQ